MIYKIGVLPGDGVGPEVISQAVKVLDKVGETFGHRFEFTYMKIGGDALDSSGVPLPEETLATAKMMDSVLLGAVGGPAWDNIPPDRRPEKGLLQIRQGLGLYANLRPAVVFSQLKDASPLKESIIGSGLDILMVRELTGGIYFGEKKTLEEADGSKKAYDVEVYTEGEIRRIARTAFGLAMKRNKKLTSIDKANVLESSRLWRKTIDEVAEDYPEVTVNNQYVDNAAMQLIMNPRQYDVILTNNIFGDILSDEASQITGSIGMLPSASLGDGGFGMYEPVHGSAPDIAGKNLANPIAAILSASMMLKYSLGLAAESEAIEDAVSKVLDQGYRTMDLRENEYVSTSEMGDLIAKNV